MTVASPENHAAQCPVELIAVEAASIIRAIYALSPDDRRREMVPGLALPDLAAEVESLDGPSVSHVRDRLVDRLKSLLSVVSHRTPTSAKGAVLQLYMLHRAIYDIGEDMDDDATWRARDTAESLLLRSISALDRGGDQDLNVLRSWLIGGHMPFVFAPELVIGFLPDASSAH